MPASSSTQPRAFPVAAPESVDLLGIPLALTDYDSTLRWIDEMVERRQHGYVCVCNVHTVMASAEDHELHTALHGSSVNVPDGQPLVWAINALGHTLSRRV